MVRLRVDSTNSSQSMASEASAPARGPHDTTPVQLLTDVVPLKLAVSVLHWQWRVLTLPWSAFLYLLGCFTSMLLRFLALSGAAPTDLVNKAKVRELASVVEHMHQREDQYRRKLQELQEEVEVRQREKKKALVKLHRARGEIINYQEHLDTVQGDAPPAVAAAAARPSAWGLHASCLLAVLCVTWFSYQDYPSLERKMVATICFPLFWMWVASLASSSRSLTAPIYSVCWFLVGFVACHKFHVC